MESERKIEKLLRAYANKRRGEAGDPLKLHPATRRLLQGEAARRASQPEDAEGSVTLWELFRQRWAVLVGFAVIVFFGAALFLPALSKSKSKAQKVTAMNNLRQLGLAAQMMANDNSGNLPASLDALTNELGSARTLTDPETGKPFIYLAAGKNLGQLSSNSVLAYSLADHRDRAVLFADGRVELISGQRLAELTNPGSLPLLASDNSASRQLAEAPSGDKKSDGVNRIGDMLADKVPAAAPPALSPPPRVEQFASTVARNSFKNTVALDRAATVLANFQVQQSGNTVEVVDADGSVYDGFLRPGKAAAQKVSTTTARPAPFSAGPAQNEPQTSSVTREEWQTAQEHFFRVTGMNRTLNQKVVFAGNVLVMAYATTNAQQSLPHQAASGGGGFSDNSQSSPTNQLWWSNSRIAGTAVIADTNNIEINAVPASP